MLSFQLMLCQTYYTVGKGEKNKTVKLRHGLRGRSNTCPGIFGPNIKGGISNHCDITKGDYQDFLKQVKQEGWTCLIPRKFKAKA